MKDKIENIGFVCLSSPVKMSANLKENLEKLIRMAWRVKRQQRLPSRIEREYGSDCI